MAGGMVPGRSRLTLAERSALARGELDRGASGLPAVQPAERDRLPAAPVVRPSARHCFVTGLPAGRCPGLLVEWARRGDDGPAGDGPRPSWFGRVVYAVVDEGQVVLVEAWVPAAQLEPAVE